MSKYAIGIDYGTLSARALVVEIGTGREVGTAVMAYPHAVMDETLPDGTRLMATIVDVAPDGMLALRHSDDGSVHHYAFKEVKHIINENEL